MKRNVLVAVALALITAGCGSRVRSDVWAQMAQDQGLPTATTSRSSSTDETVATSDQTATTLTHASARTITTVAGALPAPPDGNYVYDETDENGVHTTTTEHWSSQRNGDVVTVTEVDVEKNDSGSTTTTDTYSVTRDAFALVNDHTTYSDDPTNPDDCTYKPPMLILQLPLKVGTKWTASDVCEGDDPSSADHTQVQITGKATDVIGGVSVDTFVVKGTQTYDTTDETTGERTTYTETDTQHFDPSTLMIVSEDDTTTVGTISTTYHRQLKSLTPG